MKKTFIFSLIMIFTFIISPFLLSSQNMWELPPIPKDVMEEDDIKGDNTILVPVLENIDFFYMNSLDGLYLSNDTSPTSIKNVGERFGGTKIEASLYFSNKKKYLLIEYYCNPIFIALKNTEISYLTYFKKYKNYIPHFNRNTVKMYLISMAQEYFREQYYKDMAQEGIIPIPPLEVDIAIITRIDKYTKMDIFLDSPYKGEMGYGKFTYIILLKEKQ